MDNKLFITELLSRDDADRAIREEMDRLLRAIPEIGATVHFEHRHPHHHLDVWEHTLLALRLSKNRLKTRTALLLHDIGKPLCYREEDGIRHFGGHAEKSAQMAEVILGRLGFDEAFTKEVARLIRRHDTPMSKTFIDRDPTFAAELFEVQRCDALAHAPAYNEKRLAYIEATEAILKSRR